MIDNQKGFTLIELAIVVFGLLILAAVAIPGYKDYNQKARMRKVDDVATPIKAALALHHNENGAFPKHANAWALLGLAAEPPLNDKVSSVSVAPTTGAIVLTLQNVALEIDNTTVTMTPNVTRDGIVWVNSCTATYPLLKEYFKCHDRAIADYNEALRIEPKNEYTYSTYINRGVAWENKRDYDRAIADYNEALRIEPKNTQAQNAVAWLLASAPVDAIRDGARAVKLGLMAAELSGWKDPNILDTLAAAYAEAGNFAEAVRWQEKALESPEFTKNLGEEARQRLDLYRKQQPYRITPKP